MKKRYLLALLLVGVVAMAASGAPTFTDQDVEAGDLNPGDTSILVQTIEITGDSDNTLINAISIQNLGTASGTHIVRIELTDGDGLIGFVDSPAGLNAAGTTILTNYIVPRRETVEVHVFVDVAPTESIPAGGRTLELRTQFHYENMPIGSWIADGESEVIKRAGFERIDEGDLGDENYNPGDQGVIHSTTLFDTDANASPVTVKRFVVKNLGSATLADDISDLTLWVSYNGLPRQPIPRPAWCVGVSCWQNDGVVFDPADFVVNDGSTLTLELEVVLTNTPNNDRTLRTTIDIEFEENGQTFEQISQSPATQTIRLAGVENVIDRSTVPGSRVLTSGEVLTQSIRLQDLDANAEQVEVIAVYVKNAGNATAQGTEIQEVIVRRGGAEIGRLADIDEFHSRFIRILLHTPFVIADQGTEDITVHYVIGAATPGHTLKPIVMVENVEPIRGDLVYQSVESVYPEAVSLYPAGLEIVENDPEEGPNGGMTYTGQRLLAQRIHCVDQDENNADVTINPIVVENRGTAVGGSDITKVEIYDSMGNLLGETANVEGIEAGGITIATLQHNLVDDSPAGTELILDVFVTIGGPEDAVEGRTVKIECSIFHVEDSVGYSREVEGEEFEIEINHRPEPSFTFDPAVGNVGVGMDFVGTATDPDEDEIASYEWDFGERDAEVGDGADAAHAFAAGGTYDVTLTVTDSKGLEGTITQSVIVNFSPMVAFDWDPEAPDIDQIVQFTPTVSDPDEPADEPYTYVWDFDDENTSDLEAPTHAFSERRTYDVSLTVTDARGGTTTVVLSITVGNLPPVVGFDWEPVNPEVEELVTFTATVSDPDDPADEPYTYEWDFGDDETSDLVSPTHRYAERETYTVTLIVTDARQGRTTVSKDVSIGNEAPTVGILTADPSIPNTGDSVTFTVSNTADADGDAIVRYEWSFGDGTETTSTMASTTHVYAAPGTYRIGVSAVDERGGRSAARTLDITVEGPTRVVMRGFPNPASTTATIEYFLPTGATDPELWIFDLNRNEILRQNLPSGATEFEWNLRDEAGTAVSNGLYFCMITATSATDRGISSDVFRLLVAR